MNPSPPFALDANVMIQAKDAYYRFSFAPAFWDFLVAAGGEGNLLSIDRILGELATGGDDLTSYASARLERDFFRSSDDAQVAAEFARMTAWVTGETQFFEAAKTEFAGGVDGWLIAYAKVHGCTVVTQEVHAPDAKRKVPIPNVCRQFGVPWCNTFEMLDAVRPQFVLAS